MGSDSPTHRLARFAAETGFAELPPDVVRQATRLILDVAGNAVAGARSPIGRAASSYAMLAAPGGPSTVIGAGKASPLVAAYANARMADALDATDTYPTVSHIGGPVVCAALALAEQRQAAGKDLIRAVAIGMEVGARLGIAMGPPGFPTRMQDISTEPKASIGARRTPSPELGAAAAAAAILNLDEQRVCDAFAITAADSPTHVTRWSESRVLPLFKYADAGAQAQVGVSAALLAREGLGGYDGILDGPLGLWKYRGVQGCDFDLMLRNLGQEWFLLQNTYKPWPSCRYTHYPLTAFLSAIASNPLEPEEITEIVVRTHPGSLEARFANPEPVGFVSCQFNHPHVLAVAAYRIPRGLGWYTDQTLNDPRIATFRKKVKVEMEPRSLEISRYFVDNQYRAMPNSVVVKAGKRTFEASIDYATGDPWDAATVLSDAALESKYHEMVTSSVGTEEQWTDRLAGLPGIAWRLPHAATVHELADCLEASGRK